jgi:hypothetical protein
MKHRGRRSSASLSVVPIDVSRERPPPPKHLTPDQREVWRDIVESTPAGWFATEDQLLVAYCRSICTSRYIAKLINEIKPSFEHRDLKRWDKLLRMQDREDRLICSLATKMRLTQQARMHARSAGRAFDGVVPGKPPWED